jgi:hypothetical protein
MVLSSWFSFLYSIAGALGAHNNAKFWGSLSFLLLFVFFVLLIMRSHSRQSTKDSFIRSVRDKSSK